MAGASSWCDSYYFFFLAAFLAGFFAAFFVAMGTLTSLRFQNGWCICDIAEFVP